MEILGGIYNEYQALFRIARGNDRRERLGGCIVGSEIAERT